jgi:Domain of unknown function (DUF4194)
MSALTDIETKLNGNEERLELIRRALYQLRRRQFIWAGDRSVNNLYDAIVNFGCFDILQDHFELEGMHLYYNTAEQWVGLQPMSDYIDLMPDERLKGDETLMLLVLALAWKEGVNDAAVGTRGIIETTAGRVLDRLAELTKRDRLKNPQIKDTRAQEILKDFARRSLIAIGEEDGEYDDYIIAIRPMVANLAGNDFIDRLESFALRGMPAETPAEEPEEGDNTQTRAARAAAEG